MNELGPPLLTSGHSQFSLGYPALGLSGKPVEMDTWSQLEPGQEHPANISAAWSAVWVGVQNGHLRTTLFWAALLCLSGILPESNLFLIDCCSLFDFIGATEPRMLEIGLLQLWPVVLNFLRSMTTFIALSRDLNQVMPAICQVLSFITFRLLNSYFMSCLMVATSVVFVRLRIKDLAQVCRRDLMSFKFREEVMVGRLRIKSKRCS